MNENEPTSKSCSFGAFVFYLLFPSSPSTIFSTIISIIVNPFNACLFFTKSFYVFEIRFIHIIFENLKRLPKTFYSSSTIIFKSFTFCIITSIKNLIPNITKSRCTQSVNSHHIFSQTTARLSISTFKIMSGFCDFLSARTFANPHSYKTNLLSLSIIFSCWIRRNCYQSSKFLPTNIFILNTFWHMRTQNAPYGSTITLKSQSALCM